jgi:hypothetical protein
MDPKRLKEILEKMMQEADELRNTNRDSPKFKTWEDKVYRRIITIYGEDSREYYGFKGINFHKKFTTNPESYSSVKSELMSKCVDEAMLFFEGLIEDIELFPRKSFEETPEDIVKKIFISHSSEDKKLVSEIVHLLSLIGVQDASIFCTSLDGYGLWYSTW